MKTHPEPILPLPSPDDHHLRAAEGWLELGNPVEANEELERIQPTLRAHPRVLEVRWHIYERAGKWDGCLAIASTLVEQLPHTPQPWVHRSFALHELKRTQEAYDRLRPAVAQFPKVWLIPYNLACYCAQLGRLEECQDWFKKAMALDEHTVKQAALDDADLKPLWDSMSGTMWKKQP